MKKLLLFLFILAVYLAHQDFWNWSKSAPMLFGFLPPGLSYHAAYSIGTAVMMFILVKVAWPKKLERPDDKPPQ